jgi:Tfp pilus assembly protein PilO
MFGVKINASEFSSGIITPLLIVVVGVAGYFLIWPKYQDIDMKNIALSEKRQSVEERRASLSSVQDLIAALNRNRDKLEIADTAIPNAPRIPELLSDFDYLTKQSGLFITSLYIAPSTDLPSLRGGASVPQMEDRDRMLATTRDIGVIDIDLTLQGQYLNIKTFLANVEQSMRLMDVREIVFGKIPSPGAQQEYLIKMQAYFQKDTP